MRTAKRTTRPDRNHRLRPAFRALIIPALRSSQIPLSRSPAQRAAHQLRFCRRLLLRPPRPAGGAAVRDVAPPLSRRNQTTSYTPQPPTSSYENESLHLRQFDVRIII